MRRFSLVGLLSVGTAALSQQGSTVTAAGPAATSITPTSITLAQAIALARPNELNFAAAVANARFVALDRSIAREALLPSVGYCNEALYTQPTAAGIAREDGTTRYQMALTNLRLLTGAI